MTRKAVVAVSVVVVLMLGAALTTSGGAQEQEGQTIKLVTKNGPFRFVDHRPRQRGDSFGIGDQFVLSLPTFRAGRRIGTLDAACSATLGGKRGRGICQGVYVLPNGEIYTASGITSTNTTRGVVTGGTRAYAGARGTFKIVDRKGNGGGDPADATITLLP